MPALKAAILVRSHADAAWRDAVTAACGAGHSWKELRPSILDEEDLNGRPAAEAAFETVAGPPDRFGSFPSLYWECHTCHKWVTDKGPYESHPRDNEDGHADDCARFTAEIIAWEHRYDQ